MGHLVRVEGPGAGPALAVSGQLREVPRVSKHETLICATFKSHLLQNIEQRNATKARIINVTKVNKNNRFSHESAVFSLISSVGGRGSPKQRRCRGQDPEPSPSTGVNTM